MLNVQVNSKLPNTDSEASSNEINQGGRYPLYRYALFFFPCLVGLAADLVSKSYVFAHHFNPAIAAAHGRQGHTWWIEGVFGIETSTNSGALFGMGSGLWWLFSGFSFVALVGIIVWIFCFRGMSDRWLTFTLGLISAGILGNLYDRLGLGSGANYPVEIKHDVRDWILFQVEGVRFFNPWPNFNIADAMLVCGACMLFVHAFFYSDPQGNEKEQSARLQ